MWGLGVSHIYYVTVGVGPEVTVKYRYRGGRGVQKRLNVSHYVLGFFFVNAEKNIDIIRIFTINNLPISCF